MENTKKFKKNRIVILLIFASVSAIFLSIFSLATSSLHYNGHITADADLFMAMGKFLGDGLIPYKEFFDHKGPIIILINWLGYGLKERTGMFILQFISLTASLYGTYKIGKIYCSEKKSILMSVFSLLALNMYYERGNLTEEYCIPFLVWSLYFAIKKKDVEEMPLKLFSADYLLYGITFAVGAFTRLTNSLPVAIIVFICCFDTIRNKNWKKLFIDLMWLIVGNLIVTIPIVLFFAKIGALQEMIYATFIYNFRHGFTRQIISYRQIINMILLATPLLVSMAASLIHIWNKKEYKKESIIVLISSIVGTLLVAISRPYPHYLMIWLPTIALGMILLSKVDVIRKLETDLKYNKFVKSLLWLVLAISIVGRSTVSFEAIYKSFKSDIGQAYSIQAREIIENISEEDRKNVIAYNVRSRFYLETDILPCYKNFTLQDVHTGMEINEKQEFEKDLTSFEAKYIVTEFWDGDYTQWIKEHYELEKITKYFRLFVRKEKT